MKRKINLMWKLTGQHGPGAFYKGKWFVITKFQKPNIADLKYCSLQCTSEGKNMLLLLLIINQHLQHSLHFCCAKLFFKMLLVLLSSTLNTKINDIKEIDNIPIRCWQGWLYHRRSSRLSADFFFHMLTFFFSLCLGDRPTATQARAVQRLVILHILEIAFIRQ